MGFRDASDATFMAALDESVSCLVREAVREAEARKDAAKDAEVAALFQNIEAEFKESVEKELTAGIEARLATELAAKFDATQVEAVMVPMMEEGMAEVQPGEA